MTSVRFSKKAGVGYVLFESKGHADYAEEGSDIVCAAVSAATELVIGILENFSVDFRLEVCESEACVRCSISSSAGNGAKRACIEPVLDGYREYLEHVSKEYPRNLKCIITEL